MLHKEVYRFSPYVVQRVRVFNRGLRLRPPDNSPFWRHLTKKTLLCCHHYIPAPPKTQYEIVKFRQILSESAPFLRRQALPALPNSRSLTAVASFMAFWARSIASP